MTKKPAPRLVTVCILGNKAKQFRLRRRRLPWLFNIVKEIDNCWGKLDAVIFPGGFLRFNENVGCLDYADRARKLAVFNPQLVAAVKSLKQSPGVLVAAGVDGPRQANGDWGDQLCVAWNQNGIVGVGRKIFPVAGGEADSLVCYASDYATPRRVVELACGRRAVLCACYDMFGTAERNGRNGTQGRAIRRIQNGSVQHRRDRLARPNQLTQRGKFRLIRDDCLNRWDDLLTKSRVTVGLAAIHGFGGHSTAYWQKHGIASSSAALGRGFSVGAAHFSDALPQNSSSSTLSARNVPSTHLRQGRNRQPHSWNPVASFTTLDGLALVRLYS
jgi:hypothetical protein